MVQRGVYYQYPDQIRNRFIGEHKTQDELVSNSELNSWKLLCLLQKLKFYCKSTMLAGRLHKLVPMARIQLTSLTSC